MARRYSRDSQERSFVKDHSRQTLAAFHCCNVNMSMREQCETTTGQRRLLSVREVEQITGLSRTTIWRLGQSGEFPKSVQISPGRTAFFTEDIEDWLRTKREVPA